MSLLAKAGLPDLEKMKDLADKYGIEFLPPQRCRSTFDRSTNLPGEFMTREARLMCGIILITVPTIQYG
jgi:hypothetical protein